MAVLRQPKERARAFAFEALQAFRVAGERARAAAVRPWQHPAFRARVAAGGVLLLLLLLLIGVISTAYRAATDAFVAPLILSPDNDVVLAHEQKVIELETARQLAEAQAEGITADLAATVAEEQRLEQLGKQAAGDLTALARQRELLEEQLDIQKRATLRAKANFRSGLILQQDYEQQAQLLSQAEVALLEVKRARLKTEASATAVSDDLLAHNAGQRVDLQLLHVHAQKKAKLTEQQALLTKVDKLRKLEKRLRARPISQAMDHDLTAAFVPYSQINSVGVPGRVYACIWGLFWCAEVGSVADLVPGEVIMPDPWGNMTRGQYIVLNLNDAHAATAKVLRIRGGASAKAATASK